MVNDGAMVGVADAAGLGTLERHLKEAVGLLSPASKAKLAVELPDYADLINKPGIDLGGGFAQRAALVRLWSQGLSDAADDCRDVAKRARAKLAYADKVELASELVAAVSGSTLLGLLVDEGGDRTLKIVAAVIALAGTVLAILSRFLRRAPGGANLTDVYLKLVGLAGDAEVTAADLKAWHYSGGDPAARGEDLAAKARQLKKDVETNKLLVA